MKLAIGNTLISDLHLHTDTDDATLVASGMQSGLTGYACGQKITGSGKCFEYATYGEYFINQVIPIPVSNINTAAITSVTNMIKMEHDFFDFRNLDFSTSQTVATISVDGTNYPITMKIENDSIVISSTCAQTIKIKALFGKDVYI